MLVCFLAAYLWPPLSPRGASESLPGVAGATQMLLTSFAGRPHPPFSGVGSTSPACRGLQLRNQLVVCLHACIIRLLLLVVVQGGCGS
jgi:hypothetical protein